jgi:hypothetical protein
VEAGPEKTDDAESTGAAPTPASLPSVTEIVTTLDAQTILPGEKTAAPERGERLSGGDALLVRPEAVESPEGETGSDGNAEEPLPALPPTLPLARRRPADAPPTDLPGRRSPTADELFARREERLAPVVPETPSRQDPVDDSVRSLVENLPGDASARRSPPAARTADDAAQQLFRTPLPDEERPARRLPSNLSAAEKAPGAVEPPATKPEDSGPSLSADPGGVSLAGAAMAVDALFDRKPAMPSSSTVEAASTDDLPDRPAQPRGMPVRPPTAALSRERPGQAGTDRLAPLRRAFGGMEDAGPPPQNPDSNLDESASSATTHDTYDQAAMPPTPPGFARQSPFDRPASGEPSEAAAAPSSHDSLSHEVPPTTSLPASPFARPGFPTHGAPPMPLTLPGLSEPDDDEDEIVEDQAATLAPYAAARRERPEASEAVGEEDEDDRAEPLVEPTAQIPPDPEIEAGEPLIADIPDSRWVRPDFVALLEEGSQQEIDQKFLLERAQTIEETLESFGAPGKVVEVNTGPVITQFGVEPDYVEKRGGQRSRVKVSAISALDRDLALALAAKSIRIEAPVPGKGFVGIEVPNAETSIVSLRDVMISEQHQKRVHKSRLTIALGRRVDGAPVSADLTQMPHLLIAGATGSGKSVLVNAIISCLLLQNVPDELQVIMVDPKRVELAGYNGIPHLVAPVVVDLERIVGVLKWVQREMDDRYKRFSAGGARNILD